MADLIAQWPWIESRKACFCFEGLFILFSHVWIQWFCILLPFGGLFLIEADIDSFHCLQGAFWNPSAFIDDNAVVYSKMS